MAELMHRPEAESRVRRFLSAAKGPVVVLALVLASRTVLAQPFYVPSGSMEPTLLIGDELIVAKYAYGYSRYSLPVDLGLSSEHRLLESLPEYGDVVVFRLPRDPHEVYVKRTIGLPGDRIQMRDGRLWINGAVLPLRRDGSGKVEQEDGSEIDRGTLHGNLAERSRAPDLQARNERQLSTTRASSSCRPGMCS